MTIPYKPSIGGMVQFSRGRLAANDRGYTMNSLALAKNRLRKGELALVYSAYWRKWSRLLYMYNGTYVELDLEPIGTRDLDWNKVRGVNIRRHCTQKDTGDKMYTSVQNGSIVFRQVYDRMAKHLSDVEIATLLYRDFLPEIDWRLYSQYCNGGAFFADVMKRQEGSL